MPFFSSNFGNLLHTGSELELKTAPFKLMSTRPKGPKLDLKMGTLLAPEDNP